MSGLKFLSRENGTVQKVQKMSFSGCQQLFISVIFGPDPKIPLHEIAVSSTAMTGCRARQ
ncbi:hypothetical protein DYE49_11195 [Treponema rectale]|uniref:Uncharacterized protein n=1 Tax=Treponema rectale TaxID=744512 RepID=A0A7M1XP98_9SPIR|nr:hypothetical protein DYE49_11195 [Treponema rectale]